MKKEEAEEIKFRIDQLRKDKMIYALEAIALAFIVELSYLMLAILFGMNLPMLFPVAGLIIPMGYYIFMVIGNLKRLKEIKKLEKRLYTR